jgi:soluble lytic murein transglycosylase-like protein
MLSKLRSRTAAWLIGAHVAGGASLLAAMVFVAGPAVDADLPDVGVGFYATAQPMPRFFAEARSLAEHDQRRFERHPMSVDDVFHVLRSRRMGLERSEKRAVAEAIVKEARDHGLTPALILAVIEIESSYRPTVRSPKGAVGLMQIQAPTGEWIAARCGLPWTGENMLLDPVTNVRLGAHYLSDLHKRFGRWDHALTAYNFGPTRIRALITQGETVPAGYAGRVLGTAPTVLPGF